MLEMIPKDRKTNICIKKKSKLEDIAPKAQWRPREAYIQPRIERQLITVFDLIFFIRQL